MDDLEALRQVRASAEVLQAAKENYRDALLQARIAGCSNVAIARAAQKTEAAVRMYLKRKTWVG
jgi:DNA-directed RNA polymerase specialized sigma24 family protein